MSVGIDQVAPGFPPGIQVVAEIPDLLQNLWALLAGSNDRARRTTG